MSKLLVKKNTFITYGLVLCVLAVVTVIWPPYYSMNDDVMMKSILSGAYTGIPDGHVVYMKYPLTGLISLLYRLTGAVSWFDLFMAGSLWISIGAVISRTLKITAKCVREKKIFLVSAVAGLCVALFLPQLLTMHYTLVAAIVGGCAVFLVVTGGGYLWVVLLVLCYCIRSQVFFLTLPFLLVALLWYLLSRWQDKERKKRLLVQVAALFIGIVVCMLWNGLMYSASKWQQYLDYNESRTRLYDYEKLLPYEGNEVLFQEVGISAQEHRLLDEYGLVLDGDIGRDMLDKAADITAEKKAGHTDLMQELVYCIKEYYYHVRYNDLPYNLLMVAGYLLTLAILIRKRQFLKGLLLGCMAGGRSLIWVYLIWRGRFPERVYVSLYFLDLMILAGMLVELFCTSSQDPKSKRVSLGRYLPGILGGLTCAGLLAIGAGQLEIMEDRTREQAERQKRWDAMVEYTKKHEETLCILDVYSTVDYTEKVWSTGQGRENYLLAGGWMSGSPLLQERLGNAKDGGVLLEKAAERGDCCYIIGTEREIDWLQEYCTTRFEGFYLEKTDIISLDGKDIFYVYRPIKTIR